MADTSARTRGRRVLVTHDRLAENAIELLNAHDVDVFFSPAYAPSEQVAAPASTQDSSKATRDRAIFLGPSIKPP